MPEEDRKVAVGVIVISHCRLAEEMLKTTELIVGPLKGWKAISTDPQRPLEEMIGQLRKTIKEVDQGKGVLIFTDLLGGTPANISLAFAGPKVEVICGMNLPMLIKVAHCSKDHKLADIAAMAKEYGQRHIFLASEAVLNTKNKQRNVRP
jgi:PTS system mannose-specific IIA component